MDILLKEALDNYEIKYSQVEFIRHNENLIYKVTDILLKKDYVVRIHKPSKNFSLDVFKDNIDYIKLITSEMNVINLINKKLSIGVQAPIRNKYGELVTILSDGTPVTVLSWVKGSTVDMVELNEEILFTIGRMIGKFHVFSKAWSDVEMLNRYSYDNMLLKNMYLMIKQGIEAKVISNEQYRIIGEAIKKIGDFMKELDLQKDSKGLIHSDLAKTNLILNEQGEIILIDFGLSGRGHYYMDLGSLFIHFKEPEQQKFIIDGYRSILKEPIKAKYIEAFMAFQCILFIATHIKNAHEYKWFNKAVDKWCKELFEPLINDEQLLSSIVKI